MAAMIQPAGAGSSAYEQRASGRLPRKGSRPSIIIIIIIRFPHFFGLATTLEPAARQFSATAGGCPTLLT
jgi:hypothetical protein